ncbi:MAG TPA: PAS domain-containing protein, partial [Ramlibacter sp.]|nr:PAS domain-containing protein [Ramlibacter sp.]
MVETQGRARGADTAWALTAAVLAVAVSAAVLLGWVLGIDGLRSLVPGALAMKANTAVGLLGAGVALGLRTRTGRGAHAAANALAVLVFAIGAATLLQYLAGVDFGIDELLFPDRSTAFNAIPGRMSPFSAWSLVLLGTSIALLGRGYGWVVTLCVAQVIAIGVVCVLGYVWNESVLVANRWLPPVALSTALTLTMLGAGMFNWQRRMERQVRRPAAAGLEGGLRVFFWAILAVLLASTGFTYRSNIRFAAGAQEVERVQQARIGLADLRSCLSAEEGRDCRPLVDSLATHIADGHEAALLNRLRDTVGPPPQATEPAELQAGRLDHALRQVLEERRGALAQDRSAMLVSLLLTLALCIGVVAVLARNVRVALRRSAAAQVAVQQQQALLGAVIESSPDLIAYRDAHGHFLGCNTSYTALVGVPPEGVVGRTVDELYSGEQARQVRDGDARVLSSNQDVVSEEWYSFEDGRRALLEVVRSPMRDDEGAPIGVVVVARDVTRRHEAEEEMRRARALAEEATATKTAFLANMSHEIRTPINAITGMSHLALRTGLTPRQRDYISKVEAAGQHLVGVVDDILDFSKIEA